MAPETHTRYRVQRLIRLGEWLERNQDTLVALYDVIDDAHDMLVDPPEDMPTSDIVEITGFKQLQALKGMGRLMTELRHDLPTRHVGRGGDVTIHQPYSYKEEWEVVIKARVPDVPTQQEYTIKEQERLRDEYVAAQVAKED
jgi:hypothetical protein